MRAPTALLLAAATFGAGFLAGRFATPDSDQRRRAPTRGAAADPQPLAIAGPARPEDAPGTSPQSLATAIAQWEDAVGTLFAALDRVLPLLDYERIRYSHEWDRYAEFVPRPTER